MSDLTDAEREREALCITFHDAYEAAAVTAGWETQERSRKPWSDVPEANKQTMRATIAVVMESDWLAGYVAARVVAERERIATAIERRRCSRRARWMRSMRWSAEAEARWSQGMWDAGRIARREPKP